MIGQYTLDLRINSIRDTGVSISQIRHCRFPSKMLREKQCCPQSGPCWVVVFCPLGHTKLNRSRNQCCRDDTSHEHDSVYKSMSVKSAGCHFISRHGPRRETEMVSILRQCMSHLHSSTLLKILDANTDEDIRHCFMLSRFFLLTIVNDCEIFLGKSSMIMVRTTGGVLTNA